MDAEWHELDQIKEIRVTCKTCGNNTTFEPEDHLRSDQTLPGCHDKCQQLTNEERQTLYTVTTGLKDAGRHDGLKHHSVAVTFHT